jgi:hypothetical protein
VTQTVEFLAFYWPVILLMGVIALGIFLFRVRIAHRRVLTACIRLIGAALVLPSILLISLNRMENSPTRVFVSPDSLHIAYYKYQKGFLGRDLTVVTVGKNSGMLTDRVYEHDGPSDWSKTEVRWLNNDQLLIRYDPDPDRFQQCKPEAEGVQVQCESFKELEPPTK